jgi:site-specific recombinase XerD
MHPIVSKQPWSAFLSKYSSEDTINSYASDLGLFEAHLAGKDPLTATKADLEGFITKMQTKGLSDRTTRRRMATLKKFYRRLVSLELITKDPTTIFDEIKTRVPVRNPKALTKEQRKHLVSSLKWETDHQWQVSLHVLLGLHTGLRLNEIRLLKWADIDFEKKKLRTIGKGNKEAHLPMSKLLAEVLETYKEKHPENIYVFEGELIGEDYKPKSRGWIETWTEEVKKWCKWDETVVFTCHVLRHSFITSLAEKKIDINLICALARHSNITTTQNYIKLQEGAKEEAYYDVFD